MDRWRQEWEEPRRFEHQDDRYSIGMISQPHLEEQPYQDHGGYQYEGHDSHNNPYFSNDHWSSHDGSSIFAAPPEFQQAHEYELNEPSLADMLAQLQASSERCQASVHNLLEQDHELTTLHSSKLYDSNPLLVHNDDDDVHTYGAKREENVPLGHLLNNNMHSHFNYMEDGNREEENVLPENGFDDVNVGERSEEEDISLGRVVGHLSLDDYEHRDYERRKYERSLSRGTSRHEEELTITEEGEAMTARDPSLVIHSSREAARHDPPSTKEIVSSMEEEMSDNGHEHEYEGSREPIISSPPLELSKRKRKKKHGLMSSLFETFKRADVNVPLLKLIDNVPAYAQFLKNLCLHKRRFAANEKFQLHEEVSAIIQHRLPQRKQDFGSFIVGCRIGKESFDGTIMDMGTSINIMPLATYQRLAIGPLKTTSVSLELADGATRLPVGIVEDVLIRVNKFILPADFVVLDMNEDVHMDEECPIILGKHFMAMAGVKINVQKGTICLKVLGEKVKLQVFQPSYPQEVIQEVFAIDLVRGDQAKGERIFGPLNPLEPLVKEFNPPPLVAAHEQQEPSSTDSDDDMFDIVVPTVIDEEVSNVEQVHEPSESTTSFSKEEHVPSTPPTLENMKGLLPTPYYPIHMRGLLPRPSLHLQEHRLFPTPPNFETYELYKKKSPPLSEVQLEAIQCLREILGISVNKMKMQEWPPFQSCRSMATPFMNCFGGKECFEPP